MRQVDSKSRVVGAFLAAVVVATATVWTSTVANANWFSNLLSGGNNNTSSEPAPDVSLFQKSVYCPPVEIRVGTEALLIYERGHEDDDKFVRFQASLSKTARECHLDGDTMTMKVGVMGRLVAGPKGGAGSFTVPVRVAVVQQHGGKVFFSQIQKAPVSLSGPTFGADFSYVFDNVTFKLGPDDRDLVVYVGYDEGKPKKPVPTG